ncbi:MAG TPA: hypothetical protein VFT29_04995 [Gemmatimonadaceae bacterium]|nr:hypothetical protein [Gemmatimonadaceae bacterium]
MKSWYMLPLKVIGVTVTLFICYTLAAPILGPQPGPATPQEAAQAAMALLVVCLLDAIVMSYLIVRSRWSGWRLMAAVGLVFYGVTTFMSQIESAVFLTKLPAGMVPRLFVMGLAIAAPFAVVAVVILGKAKAASSAGPIPRLVMPPAEWAWKLAIIAVVYATLYFTFGYFIAWQSPDVRAYYGGTNNGSFVAQMASVVRDTPWLVPLQLLRGLLWAAIALPVVRMMRGPWQETALSLGALFAIVMNAQLLLPNPYMPETVRMAHMLETASSNFVFGCFVGWLLTRRAARMPLAHSAVAEGA